MTPTTERQSPDATTDWQDEWLAKGWKRKTCSVCAGHGIAEKYYVGPEGPDECRSCNGSGITWQTPKGRHVAYPGGPFV